MAYPAPGHPFSGVRNFWSNPRMILPESGTPLGVEGISDNAAVLTRNRFWFAASGDESGQCVSAGGGSHSGRCAFNFNWSIKEVSRLEVGLFSRKNSLESRKEWMVDIKTSLDFSRNLLMEIRC